MAESDRIDELITEVKELTRTLRGQNGTPGLITEFHLLKRDVQDALARIEGISQNGCNYKQKEGDENSKILEDRAPTFKWYREKFFVPVVVAIVIALINGLLVANVLSKLH